VVDIRRRYRRGGDGEWVDAVPDAVWSALLARLGDLGDAVTVEPAESGVQVTTLTLRGPTGAYGVHSLAADYGALPVIR